MNNDTNLIAKSYGAVILHYLRQDSWFNVDVVKFGKDHVFSPELYCLGKKTPNTSGGQNYWNLWVDCREDILRLRNREPIVFPIQVDKVNPPHNVRYSNYILSLFKSGMWNTLSENIKEFYYIDYVREFEAEANWNNTDKIAYDGLFTIRLQELTRR